MSLGAEAEAKLRVELDDIALDVIFQGPDSARVFNRGIASRFSKTLLNSFVRGQTTHSGGQLVLRGWEACLKWKNKTDSKSRPETPSAFRASPNPKSASMPEDTTAKPSDSASNLSLAFSTSWNRWWKSSPKLEGSHSRPVSEAGSSLNQEAMTPPRASTDVGEVPQASRSDETTEAIEGSVPQQKGQTDTVNELPEELILCIHGVGQKLADTWESVSLSVLILVVLTLSCSSSLSPTRSMSCGHMLPDTASILHSQTSQKADAFNSCLFDGALSSSVWLLTCLEAES